MREVTLLFKHKLLTGVFPFLEEPKRGVKEEDLAKEVLKLAAALPRASAGVRGMGQSVAEGTKNGFDGQILGIHVPRKSVKDGLVPLDLQMAPAQMLEQVEQKYMEVMEPALQPVLKPYEHVVGSDFNMFRRATNGEIAVQPMKMAHFDQGGNATMELTHVVLLTKTGITAVERERDPVPLKDITSGQIVHLQFGVYYSHKLGMRFEHWNGSFKHGSNAPKPDYNKLPTPKTLEGVSTVEEFGACAAEYCDALLGSEELLAVNVSLGMWTSTEQVDLIKKVGSNSIERRLNTCPLHCEAARRFAEKAYDDCPHFFYEKIQRRNFQSMPYEVLYTQRGPTRPGGPAASYYYLEWLTLSAIIHRGRMFMEEESRSSSEMGMGLLDWCKQFAPSLISTLRMYLKNGSLEPPLLQALGELMEEWNLREDRKREAKEQQQKREQLSKQLGKQPQLPPSLSPPQPSYRTRHGELAGEDAVVKQPRCEFKVGDAVESIWTDAPGSHFDRWYLGKVVAVNEDKTLQIQYDDGDFASKAPPYLKHVRHVTTGR